jgi:thymidylate synthase
MIVINARNVNDALTQGLAVMRSHGVPEGSRNGPVLRVPEPVTTVYARPCERVLLAHPWRDANPFFHLIESLWMLAGRETLRDLTPYVKRMADFSDDGGVTQPGAYGKRWRDWFADGHLYDPSKEPDNVALMDQLNWVVHRLRNNSTDRRTVIQMWDPAVDALAADKGGKDVPCNITALPYVSSGNRLHLTILCRSNDIIWGAYGANAVHFSVLLEYLAGRIGLPVGTMTQVSNNWHAYLETMPTGRILGLQDPYNHYAEMVPYGLFEPNNAEDADIMRFDNDNRERIMREDLLIFFEHGAVEAATKARWPFIRHVAVPMALAHQHWRRGRGPERYRGALEILERCRAPDWRMAATDWIKHRASAFERASDDGVHS